MLIHNSTKGIAAIAAAGISNGSFPAPAKGITVWKWEHLWSAYSIVAMGILPIGIALLFGRGTISQVLMDERGITAKVALFGSLWGLGSLLFGVSLVRLGMAITNALVSCVVVFLGSLGPILMGTVHIGPKRMIGLMLGLGLLGLSLGMCAIASISRDCAQRIGQVRAVSPSQSILGVVLAVAAGIFSSMLNIGFVYGAPLANKAKALGCPVLLTPVAIWVPFLLGGLLLNVGYPACLMLKGKSWRAFLAGKAFCGGWLRSSLMGILWFGAILLYGIGALTLGKDGTVFGWAMIIAVSILTSNGWGAMTGEWKDCGSRPKLLMTLSTFLLIFSLAILALQRT